MKCPQPAHVSEVDGVIAADGATATAGDCAAVDVDTNALVGRAEAADAAVVLRREVAVDVATVD
jgi:hypothetical protein